MEKWCMSLAGGTVRAQAQCHGTLIRCRGGGEWHAQAGQAAIQVTRIKAVVEVTREEAGEHF